MNDDETTQHASILKGYLSSRISRGQLLKASAIGAAAAAIPGIASADAIGGTGSPYPVNGMTFPFYPQVPGTYTPEKITDIINIAITAEYLAVTFLTAAVGSTALNLGSNPLFLATVQASLAEEQFHLDALASLGATPLTTNFSVPDPKMLTDQRTFFSTLEVAENLFIGAYLAAVREFAEQAQPTLALYAAEIMGIEGEHRVLARAALALLGSTSAIPPNNKAFETPNVLYVRDTAKILSDLGFLGTAATKASYPGRAAALAAAGPIVNAILQQQPASPTSSVTAAGNITGGPVAVFTVPLAGANEPGGGATNGRGSAFVSVNAATNQVCYQLNVAGITLPAIAAHIHQGPAGVNGPVVIPFTPPDANGFASACTTADPSVIAGILTNPRNWYVNVHTTEFPGGAVRGQLA